MNDGNVKAQSANWVCKLPHITPFAYSPQNLFLGNVRSILEIRNFREGLYPFQPQILTASDLCNLSKRTWTSLKSDYIYRAKQAWKWKLRRLKTCVKV